MRELEQWHLACFLLRHPSVNFDNAACPDSSQLKADCDPNTPEAREAWEASQVATPA